MQLGITTLTPAGLLVGAKSIVNHNKQLRTEMKELERELESIQGQNEFMVSGSTSTLIKEGVHKRLEVEGFQRRCGKGRHHSINTSGQRLYYQSNLRSSLEGGWDC